MIWKAKKKIEVVEQAKPEVVEVTTFVPKQVVAPAPAPVAQAPAPAPIPVPVQVSAPAPQFETVRKPIEQPQPNRIVFDLGGSAETTANDNFFAPQVDARAAREVEERELMKRRQEERRERLRRLSSEITSEAIKEKLEVPAYLRRNVALESVAHSSERNISRFNLNDDNEILGDNRFLHDNVD